MRSVRAERSLRIWATALLLGSGTFGARAADDTFFEDLDRVEHVADAAGAARTQTPIAPAPGKDEPKLEPAKTMPANGFDSVVDALALDPAFDVVEPKASAAASIAAPAVQKEPARASGAAVAAAKTSDPEPDAAVLPKTEIPAKDPLDHAPKDAPVPAATTTTTNPTTDTTAATPPAAEPLPPLNAALKEALDKRAAIDLKGAGAAERRKERDAIAFFYAAHGFSPIWSKDGKPVEAVDSVIARLAHAADDALTLPSVPTNLKAQGSPAEIVESEIALTEAVVAYARQATGARVDPRTISPLIGLRPELADPALVLDGLLDANGGAGDKLQALNPTDPRYVALRTKLGEILAARSASTTGTPVPPGPTLRVGMHDPRVPALRARLHVDPGLGNDDMLRYDAGVAQAVAAYQRASDLPASGTLTNATVAALAGTRQARSEGPIVANMELWRWMPRELGHDRIEVNIPDYIVTVVHDDKPVAQNRVVVGKTDTPTPLFSNTIKYLIVNPYWNVPQSIIKKEMLPKAGGDLSYLNGRGYSANWHGGQWVVKQLPGPKNALGRIKFLFPNDYSVYLHDTPSKALFSTARRAYSHGCVRVDQPFAFGQAVLNDALPQGARQTWSEGRLEGMVGDKERYVNLPTPLPIHIFYFTASVDPAKGTLRLRDDIYGYARAVAATLGRPGEAVPTAERKPRVVAEHVRRRAPDALVQDDLDPR